MLRREAISVLLAAALNDRLSRFFDQPQGTAVLMDVKTRRLIAMHGGGTIAPPGSTIKPFVLATLLRNRKLTAAEPYVCPQRLTIAGRSFSCSHPSLGVPVTARTAIAYSCNCFVAHVAQRFAPGELAMGLERASLTGSISRARGPEAIQLQALGESGISLTAAELAMGYRSLALGTEPPILEGMEDAVEYGTAQLARVEGMKVAGKTGSIRTGDGARIAWFAGFAPSRSPEVVVTVMLQGRSGGSDAAPIAGKILAAYRAGKL